MSDTHEPIDDCDCHNCALTMRDKLQAEKMQLQNRVMRQHQELVLLKSQLANAQSCQVALRDALKGMIELYDTDGDHTVTTGVQCKRRALDALSKSQPQPLTEVIKCECCDGKGTIDERLGGYGFSNPAAQCPDCDGYGEVEITSQPLKAAGITYPNGLPEIVPCSVAPLEGKPKTLLDFGYAPGNYSSTCIHCKKPMEWVDKRCRCCKTCAEGFFAQKVGEQ